MGSREWISSRRFAASIIALLILVALAGCGSSGGDGSASTKSTREAPAASPPGVITEDDVKPLPKAKFIVRSNDICSESWHEMLKRYAVYRHSSRASGKSRRWLFSHAIGDVFLPAILFWYDHINFLGPPIGDNGQIAHVLRVLQSTVVAGLERPYSFYSPKQFAALFRRSNRTLRAYGITTCVVTPTSIPF